jgi:dipeptidyl aminopeptidase/acylaminoacyl peptidase
MRPRLACWLAGLALLGAAGPTAAGGRAAPKSSTDRLLDELDRLRTFEEVAVSPDGKRLAWVQRLSMQRKPPSSAIYVADLRSPSAAPRRVSAGDGRTDYAEGDVAWSPDGARLTFVSDKEKQGQPQLYLAAVGGGPARKLTSLKGPLARPGWSPDGKRLAVLFMENAPRILGPLEPAPPDAGVVEEQVFEQRLCTLDPASGRFRRLSPADHHVYEYDWSPDSKALVVITAPGSGDNNWWMARLCTLGADSGDMKTLWKPPVQIAVPRWSPDGKTIALIGGLMSDEGVIGGDVYTVPAAGGRPRNLTPGLKASASWLAWQPSSRGILFTAHVDGGSGVAAVPAAGGPVTRLWEGAESIAGAVGAFALSLSRDQMVSAVVRQSFERPPEVWAGAVGAWKQITHANGKCRPAWGKARSLHWKSGRWTVQGWLLYPRDYDARKRYPLAVSVHGGPASARRPAWPRPLFDAALLSAEGYFVLFPNPRGSYGRGEEFTRANVKDFGGGDLRDILAGVDEVTRTLPVDKDRVGVLGWSYGGFMTMWAVTQTPRFRAAVAGAGIANWKSYYGQNGIDQWMIPYFGASVYDDPAVYARCSPINFIKRVRTPTLVLVGDRDVECPAPQSYEFWRALKRRGVPTQLVIYPNEGHRIGRPEHRRDVARRTVAWLNKYLRGGSGQSGGQR